MMSFGDRNRREWHLGEVEAEPIEGRAVDGGVTFFDTADMYDDGASEQITGRLLSKLFAHRDDYVLATKVFYPTGKGENDRGLSRKHIISSIDASLKRLGTPWSSGGSTIEVTTSSASSGVTVLFDAAQRGRMSRSLDHPSTAPALAPSSM